ncbi:Ig-like domain-containing protein, partial [Demetria terragena]|uniref:Ig-like domain-containing protein n=1 Tax=Demetria terragena TaxID=63959 RepID=UPI0014616B55
MSGARSGPEGGPITRNQRDPGPDARRGSRAWPGAVWLTRLAAIVTLVVSSFAALQSAAQAAEIYEGATNRGSQTQTGNGTYRPFQFVSSATGGSITTSGTALTRATGNGIAYEPGGPAAVVSGDILDIAEDTSVENGTVTTSFFSISDLDGRTGQVDIEAFDTQNNRIAPADMDIRFGDPTGRVDFTATDNGDGTTRVSWVDTGGGGAVTEHSSGISIRSAGGTQGGLVGRAILRNFVSTFPRDALNFLPQRFVTTAEPAPPVANPDEDTTPQNTPVTVPLLENDTPGTSPIDPALTTLLDAAGNPVDTRTYPGVGTFTVDDTGNVVFTPEADFTGETPAVPYRITDEQGQTADSTVTVTVTPTAVDPPVATPDSDTTPQGTPVDVPLLDNDTAGSAPIDPALTTLLDPAGNPVDELTVPGEGTYAVNDQGVVTFTPLPDFTGEATPVPYRITDENGETADSTVTITVTPQDAVPPVANPDEETTPLDTPVTLTPSENDTAGDTPIVPGETTLLDENGDPTDTVTVPDVGTFTVEPNGDVTFTPV